jgi:hypothetical protein
MNPPESSRTRHAWLPLAWLLGLAAIAFAYRSGPLSPASVQELGVNYAGEWRGVAGLLTGEVALLYAILRPWSYRASWLRPGVALLMFGPWSFLYFIASMHGGSITGWHLLWLILVDIGLLGATLVSASAAAGASRTPAA